MKNFILLITVFCVLIACKKKQHDIKQGNLIEKPMAPMSNDTINKKELSKLTLKEATNKYGGPVKENTYFLNEAILGEFRINLKNFYNEEQFKQPIPINESTWNDNSKKDTLITVWYEKIEGEWKPFDILEYNQYAEF